MEQPAESRRAAWRGRGPRDWCAHFWMLMLFFCAARALWVLRLLRPIVLFFCWNNSRVLRSCAGTNARRILGPGSDEQARERLARAMIANFYDTIIEFGRNRKRSVDAMLSRIELVEGGDRYERARREWRGAILVTAHLGSFETGLAALTRREKRVHVVFQRDDYPLFERLRREQHARLGVEEAPIDEGMRTWMRIRDALANDEVVLMQGDRAMKGQRSVAVPFMGGHIAIPDGPVRLARVTGSPIVPVFAVRIGRGVRIVLEVPFHPGPAPAKGERDEDVLGIGAMIEKHVSRYPEQWLMLQKAWLEDRDGTTGLARPVEAGG